MSDAASHVAAPLPVATAHAPNVCESKGSSDAVPNSAGQDVQPGDSPRYHLCILGGALAVLTLALVLGVNDSSQATIPFLGIPMPTMCVWKNLTGVDCPGCGMTRAFIFLAQGDAVGAWTMNPAAILLFGFLVVQIPYRVIQLWRIRKGRKPWQFTTVAAVALWSMLILLLVQWLVRILC